MSKIPMHNRKVPDFLRPTFDVARDRMHDTRKGYADNCIHALPGSPVHLKMAAAIERGQADLAAQLRAPFVIPPGVRAEIVTTPAAVSHARYHVYGSCTTGVCQPQRPEPPLRKNVHSTVLEQKQLT